MSQKPSLPKGTRDFGPSQMAKRNHILDTIKKVFKKYGFQPLETPAMENLSVLTGKYGGEGDQLLFRILNSGDFLSKTGESDYKKGTKGLLPKIAEKGLKYDLTVPFARYVVMSRNDIAFPFRRYQIQPVWRADRPQKGRYREFYQCDADIIGTESLICEAELMQMVHEVFEGLNFKDFKISLNNRKILEGVAEVMGAREQFNSLCVSLDKLDKIGKEKVFEELKEKGFQENAIDKLNEMINITGNNGEQLQKLKSLFTTCEIGTKGVKEVENTLQHLSNLGLTDHQVHFDLTLARGLSYYTGIIYEVKPTSIKMGTITAGGRYDNLTGVFGLDGVSGVGISFGIDRIYDTLEELGLFPKGNLETTQVMLTNFDQESEPYVLQILTKLRNHGISSEIYPDPAKLKKQLAYANKKGIPLVLMVGSEEIQSNIYTLKNMTEGTQQKLNLKELINFLTTNSNQ